LAQGPEIPYPKLVAALILEGATFRLVKAWSTAARASALPR